MEAKIINQINLKKLTDCFSTEQIENALVKTYIENNGLSTKNKFILDILNSTDTRITEDVSKFLKGKGLELDLLTIQKIFELLLERDEKNKTGTFYTPYFVVDFIVQNSISKECSVIDPCCGCGAFLVGATKRIVEITKKNVIDILEKNIFGIDICNEAIRRAKIILSLLALTKGEDKKEINFNLVNADSLIVNWEEKFPKVFENGGFEVVIGNPPYAALPAKYNLKILSKRYKTIENSSRSNIYIPFLEMMFNISKHNGSGGIIVPLSIAFASGKNFLKLREEIEKIGGDWKFSFYDRSPDSLFGDNIKTRNSIIFFYKGTKTKSLSTTKLIRWNSRNRDELFNKIKYQNLQDLSIKKAIPKISTILELSILNKLEKLENLGDTINIKSQFNRSNKKNVLYFYNTAYNWISVFTHIPSSFDNSKEIIPSSLYAIECKDETEAKILYSLLNSKIVYWYWTVWGDGFHVTEKFIRKIPITFSSFSIKSKERLIYLATKLEELAIENPISKVNKKKTIGNYNMMKCNTIINQIDETITNELRLDSSFLGFLREFFKEHISAGRDTFKNSEWL